MKIETHVHCSEISPCGHIKSFDVLKKYKELGYDALIMTDHLSPYNADKKGKDGIDLFEHYRKIYGLAKEEGERIGILVLCGYEFRFLSSSNDFLVYGMPDELAKDYRKLFELNNKQLFALAQEHGFLVFQAHPFRNDMKIVNPEYLSGIEVFNGSPNHDSRNEIAQAWAKKYSLPTLSGSDCHYIECAGTGGIITGRKVENIRDFIETVKSGDYSLIKTDLENFYK